MNDTPQSGRPPLSPVKNLFRVKICGVTSVDDARMVAEAAAGRPAGTIAIGLNFVPGSPRCVSIESARAIREAVPATVRCVGVFAGAGLETIHEAIDAVGLDAVQLHGHLDAQDPPDRCRTLAPLPVIRAVRMEADGLATAREWIERARAAGAAPAMVIVDATVARGTEPGRLGGSGATVDWKALAREGSLGIPTAIAGGITPDNVEEAIRTSGLSAVDTASGVESRPGRKDPGKVTALIEAALRLLPTG